MRYGITNFRVVTVTPTEQRALNLCRKLRNTGLASKRFWFTDFGTAHTTSGRGTAIICRVGGRDRKARNALLRGGLRQFSRSQSQTVFLEPCPQVFFDDTIFWPFRIERPVLFSRLDRRRVPLGRLNLPDFPRPDDKGMTRLIHGRLLRLISLPQPFILVPWNAISEANLFGSPINFLEANF